MTKYLVNFTVYILAMIGVVFTAFIVWKNATSIKNKMSKSSMKIEDSLNLAPRKNLYIIKIKNERFLIASDADKTTFLSKLEENSEGDFQAVQDVVLEEDKNDEITSKIKLKDIENLEETEETTETTDMEEAVIEKETKNKTKNMLKELLYEKGIN